MKSKIARRLGFERLRDRSLLAALDFVSLDSPIDEIAISSFSNDQIGGHQSLFRRVSMVVENRIKTVGVHPQATELLTDSLTLGLPPGAVDAVVERVVDADTGFGFAVFHDGRTESVLWLNQALPVTLGNDALLAAYQRLDGSTDVALESSKTIRVLRFAADGTVMKSITLDGTKYSSAEAGAFGVSLFGKENDLPVAAWIDEQFVSHEVDLEMPSGATFSVAVGVSQWSNTRVYTGSALDSTGETRVVKWDRQGALIHQSETTDIWALKSSGRLELVDSQQGSAVVVHDSALASLLGIEAGVPAAASQLAAIRSRGFAVSGLTAIAERDGEVLIGVTGTNASGNAVHGILVASLQFFPSPWQNQVLESDVNALDGVTPLDVLLIIDELNRGRSRQLRATDLTLRHKVDVSGDGILSPLDVLLVISSLSASRGSGEGESQVRQHDTPSDPVSLDSFDEIRKRLRF